MKKRRELRPKGNSAYAKWARRWGLEWDWVASIKALFSMAYLPLVGYSIICAAEKEEVR